eukprot:GFUD01003284.1.p1 GENE.GFUD01003284.1~~GFUD01003284.1.p1  ORF type:complete len:465 (-),score=109.47 GFUD01003284.1:19-1413(-)
MFVPALSANMRRWTRVSLTSLGQWPAPGLGQNVAAAQQLYNCSLVTAGHRLDSCSLVSSLSQQVKTAQIISIVEAEVCKKLSTAPIHDVARCPIMSCEEHREIKDSLDKENSLDLLVGHILEANILVSSLALQHNIVWLTANRITKTQLRGYAAAKSLPASITVGRVTSSTDNLIINNWQDLLASVGVTQEMGKREIQCLPTDRTVGIKRNIIGYFLLQGIPEVRLAAESFQRLRVKILASGDFSEEEDRDIIEFVEKKGKKWSELSRKMERIPDMLRHRYNVLKSKEALVTEGEYNLEDDCSIVSQVFKADKDILTDGNVSRTDWEEIGRLLNRSVTSVRDRWTHYLEPTLRRYHAGTLDTDVREELINYLVENKLNYPQDIDWDKLVKLPDFAGHTSTSLILLRHSLITCARKKYSMKYDQVTADVIQHYWHNTSRQKPKQNQIERTGALVEYYISEIEMKN